MSSHAVELATQLAEVRDKIKVLKYLEDQLVTTLAEEMEFDALIVDGVGVFERRMSRPRKAWDHELIRYDLMRKLPEVPRLMQPGTGEVESDVETFGRVLFECARPEWRILGLKKYDLDPDDYSETTPGRYNIQITQVHGQPKAVAS